jgi:pimeloyl-ACP methyl ester carboxylesterase
VPTVKRAGIGLLSMTVALFSIQSYRTWTLIAYTFSPHAYVVKPGDGPVTATTRILTSPQGHRVGAFWVPPKNGAAILLLHGTDADRLQLWSELELLGGAGYGVLAIDWPGWGESDGAPRLGAPEREAFTTAVDTLAHEPQVQNIGVLAFSQGAALGTLFSAAEPRVKRLLAVGAWGDALGQTNYEFRHGGILRQWPAYFIARHYMENGNTRPIDAAQRLQGRPTLFVVGTQDDVVPPQMGVELAQAAGGELWRIEGAGHLNFRDLAKDEWPKRVLAFFAPLQVPGP